MYYLNYRHQETFMERMALLDHDCATTAAAFYILSLPDFSSHCFKYVLGDWIDFDKIMNHDWEENQVFLLMTAKSLYSRGGTMDLATYLTLDADHYSIFTQALDISHDISSIRQ